MVTVIDNSAELSEEQADQGVNSNNSYEELKQQVNKLKEEYNTEFGEKFDYFLFIENSNRHLLEKHGEIIRLIKSNNELDREEALSSVKSVHSNVSGTISISSELMNSILETKKVA